MIELLTQMFSYGFGRRAMLAGLLVALCAALLGVMLVLKRYSMIGDGLSHVGFGALCVAMALNLAPLSVAVPVVILAAFGLLRLSESSKIKGDAAIALISSTAIAVGLIAASLTSGLNTDVSDYLFGSILATEPRDLWLVVPLAIAVLLVYLLFYNRIFTVTFDESFARATGTRTGFYNTVIAVLTAVTVVVGMRIMGTILISSLIIFPALTAMRVCRSYRAVTVTAALVSVFCFFAGLLFSFGFVTRAGAGTPPGASVVAANAIVFVIFWGVGKLRKAS